MGPHLTQYLYVKAYLRTKWHLIDPCSRSTTIDVGRKLGASPPFGEEGLGPHLHKVAWAEAYLHTKWHLDASSRLATIKRAENWGLCPLLWGGELGHHLAQCGLDQGPPPCQVPS